MTLRLQLFNMEVLNDIVESSQSHTYSKKLLNAGKMVEDAFVTLKMLLPRWWTASLTTLTICLTRWGSLLSSRWNTTFSPKSCSAQGFHSISGALAVQVLCCSVPSLHGWFRWGGFPHESPQPFYPLCHQQHKPNQNKSAFPSGDFRTVGMSVFQAAVLTINLSFWLVAMQHIAASVRKTPDIFTTHRVTQAIKCFFLGLSFHLPPKYCFVRDAHGVKFRGFFSLGNEWLKVGHSGFFSFPPLFVLFLLFSWLGKRSLFMATDDWSPVQSIRLMLIFSQKSKEGVTPSLLLCGGRGALPALLAMTSPLPRGCGCCAKKGTEKLQCSLQPMWEPACWMGFPGRNDAFPSLLSFPCSTGGRGHGWWLPGGTRVMLWALPAPDTTESLGRAPCSSFCCC